jgi:hypothetical protein
VGRTWGKRERRKKEEGIKIEITYFSNGGKDLGVCHIR